jgi:hypothetical protein
MCPTEKAGCGSVTPPVEIPTETPPVETPPAETPPAEKTPPAEETTKTPPAGGGGSKSTGPEGGEKSQGGTGKSGGGSKSTGSGSKASSTSSPSLDTAVAAGGGESAKAAIANGGAAAIGDAKAIFEAPKAWVGGPVILDGTASKAIGHLTCSWTVKEAGRAKASDRKAGCRVRYRFHHAGVAHVTLTVRGSVGSASRLSKTLVVRSRQSGQLRVSRAARAF